MSEQQNDHAPGICGSGTNAHLTFDKITKTENDIITKRRDAQSDADYDGHIGLALSGGGIRSATFSLGLLQSLSSNKLIPRIDYVSTVSGGSYIGSFFGTLFVPPRPNRVPSNDAETPSSEDWDGEKWTGKFLADPLGSDWGKRAVRNLRDFGRYLSPGGSTDLLLGMTVLVRNWLAVQMVLGLLALVVFLAVGLILKALGLPPVSITLALGWLTASLALAYWFTRREIVPAGRVKRTMRNGFFVFSLAFCACAMLIIFCGFAKENDHPFQIVRQIAPLLIPTLGLFLLFELRFGKAIQRNDDGGRAAEDKVRAKLSRATSDAGVLTLASLALLLIDLLGLLLANAAQAIFEKLKPADTTTVDTLSTTSGSHQFWTMLWDGFISYWPLVLPFIPLLLTWWAFRTLRRLGRLDLLTGSLGTTVLGLTVMASWLIIWSGNANGIIYPNKMSISWEFDTTLLIRPKEAFEYFVAILSEPSKYAETFIALWKGLCSWLTTLPDKVGTSLKIPGAAALVLATMLAVIVNRAFTFLNLSSLSTLYASRLKRAYIGASTPSEKESAFDIDRPEDHVTLAEYYPERRGHGGPLHLINVTIAQTVTEHSNIAAHDRKGKAMHIGPAGIVYEGSTPGDKVAIDWRTNEQAESLPLATWVAISGAAASTAVGTTTSPGLSMLAMMANVRLGYWWKWGGKQSATGTAGKAPLWTRAWRWFTDGVYGYLWDELNGKFRADSRRDRWYLTDGGHYDNSGIYPLLQRKLSLIIASDNGADPDYQMSDMVRLINRARTDLGADIRFLDADEVKKKMGDTHPWADIVGSFAALATRPGPNRGAGNTICAALADITYADKQKGWLLLIKPKLRDDDDPGLHSYYRQSKGRFPQQTTGDQYFEEDQWEAYRRLGQSIGKRLFGEPSNASDGKESDTDKKPVWQTLFDKAEKLQ